MDITNALRARGVGVGKKLVGDALPGDVRAGKKAMNASGEFTGTLPVQTGGNVVPGASDIVKPAGIYDAAITVKGVTVPADKVLTGTTIANTPGTMPKQAAGARINASPTPAPVLYNGGDLWVAVPPGYYYEDNVMIKVNDPDIISDNIKSGVNFLGLVGTYSAKRYVSGNITSLGTLASQIVTPGFQPGIVRIRYSLSSYPNAVHVKDFVTDIDASKDVNTTAGIEAKSPTANGFTIVNNSPNYAASNVSWEAWEG